MNHVIQWSALVLFVCVVALFAGCENKTPRPKTDAASTGSSQADGDRTQAKASVETAAAEAKQSASDAALTAKVKTALANDAGLSTLKLDVDSNAGVVRIKGHVESGEAKQRVQDVAKGVQGVRWVQNQISVAPSAPVPAAKGS
jgi:hyperosmotically inducible periplasmic protein